LTLILNVLYIVYMRILMLLNPQHAKKKWKENCGNEKGNKWFNNYDGRWSCWLPEAFKNYCLQAHPEGRNSRLQNWQLMALQQASYWRNRTSGNQKERIIFSGLFFSHYVSCAIRLFAPSRKGLQQTGDLFLFMGYNCLEITWWISYCAKQF